MKKLFFAAGLTVAALVLVKIAVDHSTMDAAFVTTGNSNPQPLADTGDLAVATFAGGCFWCIESTFEKLEGVSKAVSGYSGGTTENPTYDSVGGGRTGHTEAVQIYYDPNLISYEALLHRFWRDIDPTDANGQFADRGSEYRPAIFYHNENQRAAAIKSLDDLEMSKRFNKPIAVEVTALDKFWEAEGYHQDYYKKSPLRYKLYRSGSGRDAFLERAWGDELDIAYVPESQPTDSAAATTYRKPKDSVLRETLTDIQYSVTQNDATERPFQNDFWNNDQEGIYVDVVSGEPLFSSTTKYKSGTGWPSFWEPIDPQYIVEKQDFKLLFPRTEVRSKFGDSHLGHVFNDGPAPTGLRYCINSAALRFVPRGELAESGYGQYVNLFSQL